MSLFSFQCAVSFAVLALVIRTHAENVVLHKNNNMVNMASQRYDFHKLTKRRDLDPQTCVDNFDIHRDKIIRTEDSREMGAKYLNEIDLGSRDECLRLCCETESCDVFVFEEKSPGSCYLFHCGPPEDFKCKFTRHTNFSSAVLAVNRHLAELEDQIKLTKHEQDLASLRKQIQEGPATSKSVTIHPIVISPEIQTVVPVTVRRCSRFQFECHSSEECIAIYNACDGIPQCADGSDEAPELGCPALTTLPPPPNLPPREILPQIPQMPQISQVPQYSGSQLISKDTQNQHQHQPAFIRPIGSPESPPWPRHLDQTSQSNSLLRNKQYNDNARGSHIFNHKGGLQVTETDSVAAPQYDYKNIPYESVADNAWPRRQWPQQQPEQMNLNDGAPIYHMDMEAHNGWKQQQSALPNIPEPHRIPNVENQVPPQRIQPEKLSIQRLPNMFQDREKMWAVPQISNSQPETQPNYPQQKITLPVEDTKYIKPKPQELGKQHQLQSNNKNDNQSSLDSDDDSDDDSDESSHEEVKEKSEESSQKNKHKNTTKKHNANKTKKKHLRNEHEAKEDKANTDSDEKLKNSVIHEQYMMGKQFEDDTHDGAAQTPPGAILLLTLGVCMTSIMVVLLGCRLKMARRRMRRSGKSPFAHDADYLVNGMYL